MYYGQKSFSIDLEKYKNFNNDDFGGIKNTNNRFIY